MRDLGTEIGMLDSLRERWEKDTTTDEERAEILKAVQVFAEGRTPVCLSCTKPVVNLPYDLAVGPGHTYSNDGMAEFRITQLCEWCFDEITGED